MPASATDYRAGARVFITKPGWEMAYLAGSPESAMLSDKLFCGTIISTYGKDRFWVQPDVGEKVILHRRDLILLNEDEDRQFGINLILFGVALAVILVAAYVNFS